MYNDQKDLENKELNKKVIIGLSSVVLLWVIYTLCVYFSM